VEDRHRMIRAYFKMLLAEAEATKDLPRDARLGETAGKMKQFATWFTHGVPGGAKLRAAIYHARTGEAVLEQVELFFAIWREGEPEPGPEDETEDFAETVMICD
jgi:tRNA-dihydrouridine synthase B